MNLIEREGPIHKDAAKRRVADVFQVRMGSRISRKLDSAIANARAENYVKLDGNFLWPKNMIHATLRVHKGGRGKRSIEEIPRQEIALAVIECVRNSLSISEKDLIKETARLYGLRATKKVSAEIRWIIRSLLSTNQLSQRSGKIVMGC